MKDTQFECIMFHLCIIAGYTAPGKSVWKWLATAWFVFWIISLLNGK